MSSSRIGLPVRAMPKRAHQGGSYLAAAEAPPDLGGAGDGTLAPSS